MLGLSGIGASYVAMLGNAGAMLSLCGTYVGHMLVYVGLLLGHVEPTFSLCRAKNQGLKEHTFFWPWYVRATSGLRWVSVGTYLWGLPPSFTIYVCF